MIEQYLLTVAHFINMFLCFWLLHRASKKEKKAAKSEQNMFECYLRVLSARAELTRIIDHAPDHFNKLDLEIRVSEIVSRGGEEYPSYPGCDG